MSKSVLYEYTIKIHEKLNLFEFSTRTQTLIESINNLKSDHTIFNLFNLRRFDGDTSLLFVLSGISGSGLTGLGGGNNTGLGHQGVSEGRFSMVDVSNHGHVPDVLFFVHTCSDLINTEIHLKQEHVRKPFH